MKLRALLALAIVLALAAIAAWMALTYVTMD